MEPRETLQQKDERLAKAPPRQKQADDHARFLEKSARLSSRTPRPPSNDKTKEKTWSASESDEDDDDDLVPSINASIAEDNVESARRAAAGSRRRPTLWTTISWPPKHTAVPEKVLCSRRARRVSGTIETLFQCPFT